MGGLKAPWGGQGDPFSKFKKASHRTVVPTHTGNFRKCLKIGGTEIWGEEKKKKDIVDPILFGNGWVGDRSMKNFTFFFEGEGGGEKNPYLYIFNLNQYWWGVKIGIGENVFQISSRSRNKLRI